MKYNYLNIYNNLIKLTRNKSLYLNLNNKETFSDRLVFLLLHLTFFLKIYKHDNSKELLQNIHDFIFKQIELSIREIGYGDVSINKNMKNYVNLFYSIVEKIETLDLSNNDNQLILLKKYLNNDKNIEFYVDYFNKYRLFLANNTLKNFTKDILELKI